MRIAVRGASENNLRNIDADFTDGLTVVTGVSGSGKTSLAFDTLYHESRRRFLDVFGRSDTRLSPAKVASLTGAGPATAVGQNLLNRNPNSTLATASGLHPFLRLAFARFSERFCARCGAAVSVLTEDEIDHAVSLSRGRLVFPIVRRSLGSHKTLIRFLRKMYPKAVVLVDGKRVPRTSLNPASPHDIDVELPGGTSVREAFSLGATAVIVRAREAEKAYSLAPVCLLCGTRFAALEPLHFHLPCPRCRGSGCAECGKTGMHPEAAAARFRGKAFPEVLAGSVSESLAFFKSIPVPDSAARLISEIVRRLDAMRTLGLGYVSLDRPVPTLSRGEAQRLRLSVSLAGRLEDILHILDEPTIGLHPMDVLTMVPAFRSLAGPVVFIEHDRIAAAQADRALDIGPGAGGAGGRLLLEGTPNALWKSGSPTGLHFSRRVRPEIPPRRPEAHAQGPAAVLRRVGRPEAGAGRDAGAHARLEFLTARGASLRNLRGIDARIPLGMLTVVTGVSGSGKSTLVVDVIAASLSKRKPAGCISMEGKALTPVIVDQEPIGLTPRSNPATYTKLADLIRNRFAKDTGLSPSHFSFNRPEGACETCAGLGAVEVKMRYLPSAWIPCSACGGERFKDEVLAARADIGSRSRSISEVYGMSIAEARESLEADEEAARHMLDAMCDIGLGYLGLGQPSPTLSGGEAQRIKLAKFLGRKRLGGSLIILDEPSTGLHPADIAGLLKVLDRLVRAGATLLVIEHNSDIIRAADWILDLGPGAGPEGGRLLFCGPFGKLDACKKSLTARALREEDDVTPGGRASGDAARRRRSSLIVVEGAKANNLKNVTAKFPKGGLTVVTGVSGSGKSSLVTDVLEAEAKKRFLETLSMYERQAVKEGPETQAESVRGLGVSLSINPSRSRYFNPRFDVGAATEISHHLAILLAFAGSRACPSCGRGLSRGTTRWECADCGPRGALPEARFFSPSSYAGACLACHGVGSRQVPAPEKLIVKPDKPLCGGAMYSPGFFPGGYLCKPFNGGYDVVQALAKKHGFDAHSTPWNKMGAKAQKAFLFGEKEPLRVTYRSRTGRVYERTQEYKGFYGGWVGEWDFHGTYTERETCPECKGSRLRPEYAEVKLAGGTLHAMNAMPLAGLAGHLSGLKLPEKAHFTPSLSASLRRLRFLCGVGLGYVNLGRHTSSLSAGEAQRVKLAGLLGSGLTSLTVILDEPTRGMHPSEVEALTRALEELRDAGNTVIVVEHDLALVRRADHILEMGPGAGARGGKIVVKGAPEAIARAGSPTARWLQNPRRAFQASVKTGGGRRSRTPDRWLTVEDPRENNLRGGEARFPLGMLCGVCGVSGSGKSSLVIDTIGRALAPSKHTTSMAQERIKPGAHRAITGGPARTLVINQARAGIISPLGYLGLDLTLRRLYARSPAARAGGRGEGFFARTCTACRGSGARWIDMGFLPDVSTPCEICGGTGYPGETRTIALRGKSLPDLVSLTMDEVLDIWNDHESLARPLGLCRDAGIGYLVLRQNRLSGGEAQRLKMTAELIGRPREDTLILLDEPTVGLHSEDILRLVRLLARMVDGGRSVIVIEHNPVLLASCDWLLELGPGGGPDGGRIIAEGTPSDIVKAGTPTSPFLKELLG
jgi:excinuclease ABC subunit A